eukprot:TRINITY_DN3400_c6_g1_i1.p1 TRINITY_DN3400_c6_g1~~TRINITY_DN3400_c6_g1_i1.p1  ORF type:complete len:579 (+),score=134.44 TRINITY_DN3400_c6_g1_i1:250-1737(+)
MKGETGVIVTVDINDRTYLVETEEALGWFIEEDLGPAPHVESHVAVLTTPSPTPRAAKITAAPSPLSLSSCAHRCQAALLIAHTSHWVSCPTVNDTLPPAHPERLLTITYDAAYPANPYTIKGRLGTYLAIGMDNKVSMDRPVAKSFEHFGVREKDGNIQLFTECSAQICGKKVRKWLKYDKEAKRLVGSDEHSASWFTLKVPCSDSSGEEDHVESGEVSMLLFTTIKPVARWDEVYRATLERSLAAWSRIQGVGVAILSEDSKTRRAVRDLTDTETTIVTDGSIDINQDFKTPTYSSIFHRGQALALKHGKDLAMYCNGDILFTSTVMHTVAVVHTWMKREGRQYMMVGRRFNKVLGDEQLPGEGWEEYIEAMKGQQWQEDAIDYFIFSKNLYNWQTIPPMVIGGTAFDNWILQKALDDPKVTVVDGTLTITAVHQSTSTETLYSSHKNPQSEYNHKLGEQAGGWARGKVTLAPLITAYLNGKVVLYERGTATT